MSLSEMDVYWELSKKMFKQPIARKTFNVLNEKKPLNECINNN